MSDSKTVIAVQASLVSWEGGSDICANMWDGKLVVEHTLERVKQHFPEFPVWILSPDIPENKPLVKIAEKYNTNIILGAFNDVVSRYCLLPNEVKSVLRIIGMHPFFSVQLAKDLVECREGNPNFDVILSPENIDGQFITELFSLPALRNIADDMSLPKLRTDPARFLCTLGAQKHVLNANQYDTTSDRKKLRQLAQNVYQDDVLHADQIRMEQGFTENSQIFEHYRLGFEFAKDHSEAVTKSILDIGGALGFRNTLQKMSQIQLDYRVVDIDPEKIAQGRCHDPNTKFICGNCYNLPFSNDTFDLVFACEIIEHVEQPKRLVEEALRVAKPGGYIAISTPQNRSGEKPLNPHHLFEYTLQEFEEVCNSFNTAVTYFTFFSGTNFEEGLKTGNNMMSIFCKH